MTKRKDFDSDSLLALNGDRYFVDDKGDLEVIFKITPYEFKDAHTLVADFWKEVDKLV